MSTSIEENSGLHEEFRKLNLEVVEEGYVATLALQPIFESQIQAAQLKDPAIAEIRIIIRDGEKSDFSENMSGLIMRE